MKKLEDLKHLEAEIIPDEEWDRFREGIRDIPEERHPFLKIGYVLGRYTNLDFDFRRTAEGDIKLNTSQDIDLTSLFKDILEIWRKR